MSRIKQFFRRNLVELKVRDYNFIQMRLLASDFTPEFEEYLKQKMAQNIVQAKIREATEKDIKCLIELHERAWHSTPIPFRPLKEESIVEKLENPDIIFLVAEVNGEDSAFALIYYTGEENTIGVIAGMGIVPELHRKGLGTILAIAVWDYFKKTGVTEFRCKVHKDNKIAYDFIKGLKFEEYNEDYTQWKIY